MQNYIDALVAHNNAEAAKAEAECKATREKIKTVKSQRTALAAKILGAPEKEVSAVTTKYDGLRTGVKRWPGVTLILRGNKAWDANRGAVKELEAKLDQCCKTERAAKERNSEKTMFAFRRFVRARFGQKPTTPAKQVIAEFIESMQPFSCKAK